ncbi:hypothetical protein BJV78DRAFT_537311 [Lactifluus subvellereus]|nr:hypothetical protein BJV78DRAFT_537311 [Lactifluus subvellereus]
MSICEQDGKPGIASNSDVAGIGIRVNFYVTMLLLALVPKMPETEEVLAALYSNAGLSGLGLLVTAIVQTATRQLSLFHAIFVFHILFFLGIGAAPMGKYKWSRSRFIIGVLAQLVAVIGFTGWALYLWVHVKDYGSQVGCNDKVKYVLMFVSVRATKPWVRDSWIAILVASAVGLLIRFGISAVYRFTLQEVEKTDKREEEGERGGKGEEGEGKESKGGWYFDMDILSLLWAIYATVMLELTVRRNDIQHGGIVNIDNAWAFGQILSAVMIIASLNEVVHFFLGILTHNRTRAPTPPAEAEEAPQEAERDPATVTYQSRGRPTYRLSGKAATPPTRRTVTESRDISPRRA